MPNNEDDFETITQPIIEVDPKILEWDRLIRSRAATRDLREKDTKALEALYNASLKEDDK